MPGAPRPLCPPRMCTHHTPARMPLGVNSLRAARRGERPRAGPCAVPAHPALPALEVCFTVLCAACMLRPIKLQTPCLRRYFELVNFHPGTIEQLYKVSSINLCPNTTGQVRCNARSTSRAARTRRRGRPRNRPPTPAARRAVACAACSSPAGTRRAPSPFTPKDSLRSPDHHPPPACPHTDAPDRSQLHGAAARPGGAVARAVGAGAAGGVCVPEAARRAGGRRVQRARGGDVLPHRGRHVQVWCVVCCVCHVCVVRVVCVWCVWCVMCVGCVCGLFGVVCAWYGAGGVNELRELRVGRG